MVHQTTENVSRTYKLFSRDAKAKDCVQCGSCEKQCPQHIAIIDYVSKLSALLDA
jgi:predicted aldo/keto reductase-like oxidoreductase